MLHFTMKMPFPLMAFYGSIMILIVLLLRGLLKNKLPKFVFPVLWCVVLVRLLVPFSLSSPLSIKLSENSPLWFPAQFTNRMLEQYAEYEAFSITEDTVGAFAYPYDTPVINQGTNNEESVMETAVVEDIAGTAENSESIFISEHGTGFSFFPRRIPLIPIYFVGLFITVGILLFQKYRYNSKLKNRLLIEHNNTINTLLRKMQMGHILVFTNDEIASPLVCGLLAPYIYLPTRMDFQNTELLRHIFTHETMHIKRKDNWIKAIMLLTLCLNWYNPLIWIMSKCLSADLETACDEAVLRLYPDEDQRKSYAFSLLAMAITGNRPTLLYSAFSKTEVEKRIQSILQYKKASSLLLIITIFFLACSTTAFATSIQAPFSTNLSGYCASGYSRWAVSVELTRDIVLGQNPQKRAADIVFDILRADTTDDPDVLKPQIQAALSNAFHVEKGAFHVKFSLSLSDEEREQEYITWNLSKDQQGCFLYKGEPVRVYIDEMIGHYQSREYGTVDVVVHRDRLGNITDILTQHKGESDFDRRTINIEQGRTSSSVYETSSTDAYTTW